MRRKMLLVLATAGLLAACSGSHDDSGGESAWQAEAADRSTAAASLQAAIDQPKQQMSDAYAFCVEQITNQLKAPATARFSERAPDREARDGDSYLFTGTVDSENSFGALIRSDFGCEIQETASGGFVAVRATIE